MIWFSEQTYKIRGCPLKNAKKKLAIKKFHFKKSYLIPILQPTLCWFIYSCFAFFTTSGRPSRTRTWPWLGRPVPRHCRCCCTWWGRPWWRSWPPWRRRSRQASTHAISASKIVQVSCQTLLRFNFLYFSIFYLLPFYVLFREQVEQHCFATLELMTSRVDQESWPITINICS